MFSTAGWWFESEEAACRNSERPEEGAWWAETEKSLEDPKFQDSVDVVVTGAGGSNDAGFVQVMRGTRSTPPR